MRWLAGVLVVTLVVTSSPAWPSGWNSITLSDSPYSDLGFIDIGSTPGLVSIYVVVRSSNGLRGIEFAAPPPNEMGLSNIPKL